MTPRSMLRCMSYLLVLPLPLDSEPLPDLPVPMLNAFIALSSAYVRPSLLLLRTPGLSVSCTTPFVSHRLNSPEHS